MLVDFGLTIRLTDCDTASNADNSMQTENLEARGTPEYMAPECWAGDPSLHSDLWAVGVSLFFMITGELPFKARSGIRNSICAEVVDRTQLSPSARDRFKTSLPVSDCIATALAKGRELRYQSAAEMRDGLQSALVASSQSSYDIFFSYRVSCRLPTVERLFESIESVCSGRAENRMNVFWDKVRLEDGKEWEKGFVSALSSTVVFAPILCPQTLDSFSDASGKHDALRVDNLLLEFLLALELFRAGRLKAVMPLVFGNLLEDGSMDSTAWQERLMRLPDDVPRKTLQRLAVHTSSLGIDPPYLDDSMTVRGVIDAIMKHQGVIMWADHQGLQEAEDSCIERLIRTVRQNAVSREEECSEEPATEGQLEAPPGAGAGAGVEESPQLDTWTGVLDFLPQSDSGDSGTFGF